MKILIVEDKPEYREVAQEALAGEDLIFASTYAEAAAVLTVSKKPTERIEGIVTDLFFPEATGFEVGPLSKSLVARLEQRRVIGSLDRLMAAGWKAIGEEFAPLGLHTLWRACALHLPVVLLTQGDRHCGALGYVRNAVPDFYEGILRCFAPQGNGADKAQEATWQQAVQLLQTQETAWSWVDALRQGGAELMSWLAYPSVYEVTKPFLTPTAEIIADVQTVRLTMGYSSRIDWFVQLKSQLDFGDQVDRVVELGGESYFGGKQCYFAPHLSFLEYCQGGRVWFDGQWIDVDLSGPGFDPLAQVNELYPWLAL